MEDDGCRDPARDRKGAPGEGHSRNAEDSHQAEMDAWKKNTVFAQVRDHAEIVVLEGVPEIPELAGEEAHPGAGIRRDVIAGLARPVPGNLRTAHDPTRGGFGLVDRVLQHLALASVQTGEAR